MSMNPIKPDSKTIVILFVTGASLVLATFTYSFVRRWPTFDPLVTATMIGVGLLLIVIYERLGLIHKELQTIAVLLDRTNTQVIDGRVSSAGALNDRDDAKAAAHAK
jgi:hypothetical protein